MKKMNKKFAVLTASAVLLAGLGAIKAYAAVSETYEIYSFSTGSVTSTYTLTLSDRSELASYALLPNDNRVVYNNSGVVRLQCEEFVGTGFVVDDHTIATVANNVYHYKSAEPTGEFMTDLTITLYDNAGNQSMTITPDEAHIPRSYRVMSTAPGRAYANYALINVSEDLSSYEHFDLGQVMDGMENNTVVTVRAAGICTNESDGIRPYTSVGRFGDFDNWNMECTSQTTATQIGGPVYLTTVYRTGTGAYNTATTVVGFVTSQNTNNTTCDTLRITPRMLQFYNLNEYNTY